MVQINNMTRPSEGTVEVFLVSDNPQAKLKLVEREKESLKSLFQRCMRYHKGRLPLDDDVECGRRLKRARMFLAWLQTDFQMTPEIKGRYNMNGLFKLPMGMPGVLVLPQDIADGIQAQYQAWEDENWGADAVVDDEVAEEDDSTDLDAPPAADGDTLTVTFALPSPDDRYFGPGGIMYGITVFRGKNGRKGMRLNILILKRSAKVYGHNGLVVGTWFAFQLCALQQGAHGTSMGGISGDTVRGAFSIVLSGKYHDLDRDLGDIIFYSGSGSHTNEDPNKPNESTSGTKSLKASIASQNPVRVLRSGASASGNNEYFPPCGIRYDGLYRVEALFLNKNTKGGMYEQFKLRRLPGQTPLDQDELLRAQRPAVEHAESEVDESEFDESEPVDSEFAASKPFVSAPIESETAERKRSIREAELDEQFCQQVEKRLHPDGKES
ncbi:Uu.00g117750.m01.CDS01 [Anthostomella pinea]|uniref:Uu.00g117750.m01.CDS01 n=1 Tax=Anthostomella pinea TaxID=933095 RepID=A0AAI8YGZ4_9PEZI|nr:Uu.00g117750.m01.CDS01 [Anthostomella pinea]